MHPVLGESMREWKNTTAFSQPTDWVFPSFRRKGRQPRTANMLVEDHLRPAAVAAGVLFRDDSRRFGFHNLRHSLASFLVRSKTGNASCGAQKLIGDLLDSEIARFFVVLTVPQNRLWYF